MVGDDLGDFLSGVRAPIARRRELTEPFAAHWGTKWIILPNPGYGSWELALTEEKRPAIDLIDPRQ
jgi:acid phosphatase